MEGAAAVFERTRAAGVAAPFEAHAEALSAVKSLADVDEVHRLAMASTSAPRRRVGWKIGMNNPDGAFASIGLSEPWTAPIFAECLHTGERPTVATPFITDASPCMAEAEWAFVAGRDIAADQPLPQLEGLVEAFPKIGLAIELASPAVLGDAPWLVKLADQGLCTAVVFKEIGETKAVVRSGEMERLARKEVTLLVDGTPSAPPATLDALVELHRLVRLLQRKGFAIAKGDVLITGAVLKRPGVKPGSVVTAKYASPVGKGEVEVSCVIGTPAPKL